MTELCHHLSDHMKATYYYMVAARKLDNITKYKEGRKLI